MSDPRNFDGVLQAVRLECYRENIYGALEILDDARARHSDPRCAAEAARIRSWLTHLDSREAYVGAHQSPPPPRGWRAGLKLVEKRIRRALGRETPTMGGRRGRHPELQELERDILTVRPTRVLDAACGEGAVAMAIAARYPATEVEGVDIAAADVQVARALNRSRNATFREGLADEIHTLFPLGSFDLAYAFGVLECVRDVERTIRSITAVLRPGGRVCFAVPMHEFRATGPLPEYAPPSGYARRCRVFAERDLHARFGREEDYRVVKIPRYYEADRYPKTLQPIEFGSFYVSYNV